MPPFGVEGATPFLWGDHLKCVSKDSRRSLFYNAIHNGYCNMFATNAIVQWSPQLYPQIHVPNFFSFLFSSCHYAMSRGAHRLVGIKTKYMYIGRRRNARQRPVPTRSNQEIGTIIMSQRAGHNITSTDEIIPHNASQYSSFVAEIQRTNVLFPATPVTMSAAYGRHS